ncbi:MAG: AAA family ATPase [Acidobacteriota bacterium]
MEGKQIIKSIRLQNLLSYGSKVEEIKLEPLNVIIGRNASGKSNFVEVLSLLRSTPSSLTAHVREAGGISDYLWKGENGNSHGSPVARLSVVVDYPGGVVPLRYDLGFTMVGQGVAVVDESIRNERPLSSRKRDVDPFYNFHEGEAVLSVLMLVDKPSASIVRTKYTFSKSQGEIHLDESILSQKKGDVYPEITYLGGVFGKIRTYGELNVGPNTIADFPQRADQPDDFLLENASNLGMVIDDFGQRGVAIGRVVEELKEVYPEVERIITKIRGGTVQVFIKESGLTQPIPANRLSDGTLRYLCFLTILCHPEPPPLICIEEPEIGLHPDVIPKLAQLLMDASVRTQLVVTTHSDTLVSALSDSPQSIIVCERDYEGTHLRRLEPKRMKEWLESYSMGELWRMGEIGGNRW